MSCSSFLKAYRKDPSAFEGTDGIPDVSANRKIAFLATRKAKNVFSDMVVGTVDRLRTAVKQER